MYKIIDGKLVSNKLKETVKNEVIMLEKEHNITPCLAVIIVGNNPASSVYVRNKIKACEQVGINSLHLELPEDISEIELMAKIHKLNNMKEVNGILVQLPLPKHINKENIIDTLSEDKDVDCFKLVNIGKLYNKDALIKPCTPAGIIELLKHYNIQNIR